MKAVILAGGLGTRISEETSVRPKPMVEIGGRPILWHILKIYSHYGINDFIVCLGYKGYIIKEFFEDAPKLSVTIWRQMSGHAHGYGWAVQSSSKVERSVKIPGGLAVTLTIGDDNFETIVMLVGLLLARAIDRYAQLSEVELISPTATVL